MLIPLINRIQYLHRRLYSRLLKYFGGFRFFGAASVDPSVRIDNPEGMRLEDGVLVLRGGWLYCMVGQGGEELPDLTLGAGTYVGHYSHITCARRVRLGKNCFLSNYVLITDSSHRYEDIDLPVLSQGLKVGEVEIGEGTWIGEHACVYGQVRIGRHCVIGANSVLANRDLPDYSVAVGAPARIVRRYDPETKVWRRTNADGQFRGTEGINAET